ncbi:UNVERIFIED_CONTAM: hypothetical protein GTU68_052154 [Idotea baltica]|nr:hypothetical protein [Idotea baltica]
MNKKALLVIDLQNDYFPTGKFPLWNTDEILQKTKTAIKKAQVQNISIIHIQHIADPAMGIAPFFNEGTEGAAIHADILAAAPNANKVIKHFADSFEKTNLETILQKEGIDELLLCGMMTQNCVTHTALSKTAEKYKTAILMDCCTTVDAMIHNIALHAVSTRIPLITVDQAFD